MSYRVEVQLRGALAPLGPPSFATLHEAQQFIAEMATILPSSPTDPVLFQIFDRSGRLISFKGPQKGTIPRSA